MSFADNIKSDQFNSKNEKQEIIIEEEYKV